MEKNRVNEQKLLLQVCLEDAKTEQEVQAGYLDYEFFLKCLEVQKMTSLMGFGKKRTTGYLETQRIYEHYLDERIAQDYEFGIKPLITIKSEEIKQVYWLFKVKYDKIKGTTKKRKHTDTQSVSAQSEDDAIMFVKHKVKKLKEEFVEVLKISKVVDYIVLINGNYIQRHQIETIV
jgi:DNA-dependent RNA polymerase auxiliary subunit epsilon